jgi:uncharacterized membrane protein YbhN (UPF0104 family)
MRTKIFGGVKIVVSLGLLILVGRGLDWSALLGIVVKINGLALFFVLVTSPIIVLGMAVRLKYLFSRSGYILSISSALRVTWVGQFFNTCLPGSTGGDVMKFVEMNRLFPDAKAEVAALIFTDRVFGLLGLIVLAAVSLPFSQPILRDIFQQGLAFRSPVFQIAAGVSVFIFLVIVLVIQSTCVRSKLEHIIGFGERLIGTLRYLIVHPSIIVAGVFLAVASQLAGFSIVYILVAALDLGPSYIQTLSFMSIMVLILMLPVTVNGHGLRELYLLGYLASVNHSIVADALRERIFAFSLLLVANDLVCSAPGGLWYMLSRRRTKV